MSRISITSYIISITLLFMLGGIAWGQCDPSDGNNDAAHAQPIGLDETVSDWVCPDDPFDFYVAEIPEGAEISGTITFSSPQVSTVLRVEHEATGTRVIPDWSTNEARSEFSVPITPGDIPGGRYIIRVSFWSDTAYDHEYTLTIDLSVVGGPECVVDGNDEPADAVEIAFDTVVNDWVCDIDHIDIWHFTVDESSEGRGSITLNADPGELILYLYDSSATELFHGSTDSGTVEYILDSGGPDLEPGEYYIGVFLPLARADANSYSLQLRDGPAIETMMDAGPLSERLPERPPANPWPNKHGSRYNANSVLFSGPPFPGIKSMTWDTHRLTRDQMETHHRKYRDPIVSAHQRILVMDGTDRRIIALNSVTGDIAWEGYTFSYDPPCLGNNNDVYFLDQLTDSLVCADVTDGEIWWSQPLEETGHHNVKMVGTYVYTTVSTPYGAPDPVETYVQAWNIDSARPWDATGNREFEIGPIPGYITGVIEDGRGYLYVQTYSHLCKYNLDGGEVWTRPLERSEDTHSVLGPVLDPKGRVWVHHYWSGRYVVYNKDGSIHKEGDYGFRVRAICFDHKGRTYVADEEEVHCFKDYDALEWTAEIDGHYIDDMALDVDGRLYLTRMGKSPDYKSDLIILDSGDGSEISRTWLTLNTEHLDLIESRGGSWHGSHVAIGPGEKVICLQRSGILEVIGSVYLKFEAVTLFE